MKKIIGFVGSLAIGSILSSIGHGGWSLMLGIIGSFVGYYLAIRIWIHFLGDFD